jgi:biotin transporter BioY
MQENEQIVSVPYIVYESAQSRSERTIKRLIIALILAVLLIFASNAIWLYCWMQYDYADTGTESTVDVDADNGVANYIGNDGDIVNGTDKSNNNNENP